MHYCDNCKTNVASLIRDRAKKNTKTAYDPGDCVYVLSNPAIPGVLKVGRTKNINKRLCSLNVGTPVDFEVEYLFSTPTPTKTERRVHRRLEAKKVKGEWFAAGLNEIIEAINFVDPNGKKSRISEVWNMDLHTKLITAFVIKGKELMSNDDSQLNIKMLSILRVINVLKRKGGRSMLPLTVRNLIVREVRQVCKESPSNEKMVLEVCEKVMGSVTLT